MHLGQPQPGTDRGLGEISEEPQNDDRALPRRQVVQCSTELMAVLGDLQFPVDATQYVGRRGAGVPTRISSGLVL